MSDDLQAIADDLNERIGEEVATVINGELHVDLVTTFHRLKGEMGDENDPEEMV